jgi:hypothetical protein
MEFLLLKISASCRQEFIEIHLNHELKFVSSLLIITSFFAVSDSSIIFGGRSTRQPSEILAFEPAENINKKPLSGQATNEEGGIIG